MGQRVATNLADGSIAGGPLDEPRQCTKSVDFGELDPEHAQFILEAVGRMPVTEQRADVLSWCTYRFLLCTRPELVSS